MVYEFWLVDLEGPLPSGLTVFPSVLFSSLYLYPEGSVAKSCLEEFRATAAEGQELVTTSDEKFDRTFVVTCEDHKSALEYLTPERRKALRDISKHEGFVFDGHLIVEKEQAACTLKVLNSQLTRLLEAAQALDAAPERRHDSRGENYSPIGKAQII